MILTVTKMAFQKLKPRVVNYRDYTHFNNERFRDDLASEISNSYLEFDNNSYDEFFKNVPINIRSACAPKAEVYEKESYAIYE